MGSIFDEDTEDFRVRRQSALAGLETSIGLVNDEQPPTTSNDAIVSMPLPQRFYRVSNFHNIVSNLSLSLRTRGK